MLTQVSIGHGMCAALALFAAVITARAELDAPVSPDARPEVARQLEILDRVSGRYILAGQMEIGWDPARTDEDIAYVERTTGKLPVIRGLDYGDYTDDRRPPATLQATERALAWARRGGIVTFSCHMAMVTGSHGGTPAFYTKDTDFDVRRAVVDGTAENRELLRKLDRIATELKRLQQANVVVIWRPWHECSGGWFWWGAHGPEPFRKLWRLTFNRFHEVHHLNNLIWCYTPTEKPGAIANWYPGDRFVDMVGLDFYPHSFTWFGLAEPKHPTFAAYYRELKAFTRGRKVIALTENGAIPDPDRLFQDGAGWAYFLTWNQFENNPEHNSAAFLRRVYDHPRVVTLERFPAIVRELSAANSAP